MFGFINRIDEDIYTIRSDKELMLESFHDGQITLLSVRYENIGIIVQMRASLRMQNSCT